jgi:probable selenium-dependent hydroxylase accessory protein YqeC
VTLAEALGIRRGDVVAFIGGGGKTTAMYRAASDLAARGLKVIVTTTTKIFPPDRPDIALVLAGDAPEALASRVAAALAQGRVVAVARNVLPDGKLEGLAPEAVADLSRAPEVAAVLVEADGSARKPFKAPAQHEPVIPPAASLVVVVVGAEALGRPLSADVVHRPELAAMQAGMRLGDTLTPVAVARVLLGRANLRGRPAGARLAALITQVRTPAARAAAGGLAHHLRSGGASPVVLAELVAEPAFIAVVG